MKKHAIIFIILSSVFLSINAQNNNSSKSGFDSSKLIFGGDIGFGISKNYWTIGVAPQIGYKLTDKFHVGAGLGYRYGKENSNYYIYDVDIDGNNTIKSGDYKLVENSVSFNLFANYYPWKKLVFSIRPEIIHTWYKEEYTDIGKYSTTKFVPALIVGGGIHLKPVILQLNYELIQDKYSPYSDNVFLSIGFLF